MSVAALAINNRKKANLQIENAQLQKSTTVVSKLTIFKAQKAKLMTRLGKYVQKNAAVKGYFSNMTV